MVLISQYQELGTLREVASLGSFVTFLAMANFAISWSRMAADLATMQERRCAKQVGLDLFLASLLALLSQALIWAAPLLKSSLPVFAAVLMVLHVLLLAFSWTMAWLPMRRLLLLIRRQSRDDENA
ncbi:MAG: hypothetical protein ACKOCM_04425 [Cyanobacteriota bacterium]